MADPWIHAQSSAKRFGGLPEDYIKIHLWLDDTKRLMCDFRHRALRHHSEGVAQAVERFGAAVYLECGKSVPVRQIAEQHIREDLGRIPTVQDWLVCMKAERWMGGEVQKLVIEDDI